MSGTIASGYSSEQMEVANVLLEAIRNPKRFFTFRSRYETENKISYVARAIFETLAKVMFISFEAVGELTFGICLSVGYILALIPKVIGGVVLLSFKDAKIEQSVNRDSEDSSDSIQSTLNLPALANVTIES